MQQGMQGFGRHAGMDRGRSGMGDDQGGLGDDAVGESRTRRPLDDLVNSRMVVMEPRDLLTTCFGEGARREGGDGL